MPKGKKVPDQPTTSALGGASDMQQMMEMFQTLQLGMNNLQSGQENLQLGQDNLQKNLQKDFKQEISDLKEEIKKDFVDIRNDFKKVQLSAEDNKKRVENLEGGMKEMQNCKKEMESTILKFELDRTSYFLRFQNIEEKEGEDLKGLMCTILSEFVGKDRDHMYWDIDQVYRVNSNYAKIHNVPREIHVKFSKLETKDQILRTHKAGALKFGGKEVNILKQIPKKIRNIRQKYFFLSTKLYQKGVMFRWMLPEGLLVFWEDGRKRIHTVGEAEAFLKEHKNLLEGEELGAVGGVGEAGTSSGTEGGERSGI